MHPVVDVRYAYRTRNVTDTLERDVGTWGCGWAGDAPGDRYLGRIKVGVMPEVGPTPYRARATGYITLADYVVQTEAPGGGEVGRTSGLTVTPRGRG